MAHFALGRLEGAALSLQRALDLNREYMHPAGAFAATYGQLGRVADAKAWLEAYCDHYGRCLDADAQLLWSLFRREEDRKRLVRGLVRGAGVVANDWLATPPEHRTNEDKSPRWMPHAGEFFKGA